MKSTKKKVTKMNCGGKVHMAKGGMARGCGRATKGKRYSAKMG